MATIHDLEDRLAALEARLGPAPQAVPPITVGELADVPAPGSPIASQWAQEVSNRIVHRFADATALNAWAAANGSVAYNVATGRYFQRVAGAWQLWTPQRIGIGAQNPGQSWTSFQSFPMNWPTESWDTDNFGALGATLTVPAGLDGLYLISAYVLATSAIAGAPTSVQVFGAGGTIVGQAIIPVTATGITCTAVTPLTASQTAQINIISGHNAAMTYSGVLRMHRLSQ